MQGEMYVKTFEAETVTTTATLFGLGAGAAANIAAIVPHAVFISQSSDLGASELEGLRIEIGKHNSGIIGSGNNPRNLNNGQADFNGDSNANATEIVLDHIIHTEVWQIQNTFVWLPTPEMRPFLSKAQTNADLAINLAVAPNDSLTVSGTIYFEVIGN